MNDYHAAIYEAEEFMGGPATPPKGLTVNKTITGTITGMERRQNTVDANPRWVIELDANRTYTTKDDTACAYIPDFQHKGSKVTLTLDGRGQVIGYETN